MRKVILESPFSAPTPELREVYLEYARACIKDSLMRGEAPIASHLLYTQPGILNDDVLEERTIGMNAGWAWFNVAEACVVYRDHGVSRGMIAGMDCAHRAGVAIEHRLIL